MPSSNNYWKLRYRHDPEFRAAHLAMTKRRKERLYALDARYRRLDAVRKAISQERESIAYHMAVAEKKDKRLLKLIEERDELASALRKAYPQEPTRGRGKL